MSSTIIKFRATQRTLLRNRGTTYPQKQANRRCQEEFSTNNVETEITIKYIVSVEIKIAAQ
jgi:hypothetical protein